MTTETLCGYNGKHRNEDELAISSDPHVFLPLDTRPPLAVLRTFSPQDLRSMNCDYTPIRSELRYKVRLDCGLPATRLGTH